MSASNCSIDAFNPQDLNCASTYSATLRLAGLPAWCGFSVMTCMYWRRFSGLGMARNRSSVWRSASA